MQDCVPRLSFSMLRLARRFCFATFFGPSHVPKQRQRRLQFSVRSLFLAITVACLAIGVRTYRQDLGDRRLAAANTLREYGILVLEAGHSGDSWTATPRTGEWHVTIRGVRRYENYNDGLVDTFLADAMSADQLILVMPNVVRERAKEIQRHIEQLPNVRTIFINDRLVSQYMVDYLKLSNKNADVRFSSNSVPRPR